MNEGMKIDPLIAPVRGCVRNINTICWSDDYDESSLPHYLQQTS